MYNGEKWAVQDSGIGYSHLMSVCFPDTSHGWAVGDSGVILKYDGKHWMAENCPTNLGLGAVYFTDSTHGWAVGGENGENVILKYNGIKWIKQNITNDEGYNSVFFLDNNNGWACGPNGTIVHTTNGGDTLDIKDPPEDKNQLSAKIYPNPLNQSSVVSFRLPEKSFTTLKIYDFTGRLVSTLVNEIKEKGNYKIPLNSLTLPNGIYLLTLSSGNHTLTKKITVFK